jgi:hypothetical protein
MGKIAVAAASLLCLPLAGLAADRITLKNGTSYSGEFVSATRNQITFNEENGGRRQFERRDIETIAFDNDRNASNDRTSSRDRRYQGTADRDNGRSRAAYVIPQNTEIQVRTDDAIDSRTTDGGRTYSAEIYQDVTGENGNVVLPRGSRAELVIRELKEGGTVSAPKLILDLQNVEVNGQRYLVSTEDLSQSSNAGIGTNRRTAEMVGGGAALGGIIGAIAGGGKGAAIGAAVGAAAGGTAQVLTKGDRVRVPAETVLKFQLDQPVRLEAIR